MRVGAAITGEGIEWWGQVSVGASNRQGLRGRACLGIGEVLCTSTALENKLGRTVPYSGSKLCSGLPAGGVRCAQTSLPQQSLHPHGSHQAAFPAPGPCEGERVNGYRLNLVDCALLAQGSLILYHFQTSKQERKDYLSLRKMQLSSAPCSHWFHFKNAPAQPHNPPAHLHLQPCFRQLILQILIGQ